MIDKTKWGVALVGWRTASGQAEVIYRFRTKREAQEGRKALIPKMARKSYIIVRLA